MPIQVPSWYEYLSCSICLEEYSLCKHPVTLGCGHTVCNICFHRICPKVCPFDRTPVKIDHNNLVVNSALFQLCGIPPPEKPIHPPVIQALGQSERNLYDTAIKCLEDLGMLLKFNPSVGKISKPIQKRLTSLIQCAINDKDGRNRIFKVIRSLAERTVLEITMHNQNPLQLGSNLWAAVRSRGCQFLGPSIQEEVIKLVLLALEDGSALSRKVLVMFVVQRLESTFPQVSKTCIGHVVQLLYRASCFMVSRRDFDSSLMQLKNEFRTYDSLRREHDIQIVQIAADAGLKIAPDQWSSLLYGDPSHKSHMQSIIDKLQTPHSFNQSIQELLILFQRSGDSTKADRLGPCLQLLTCINPNSDAPTPSWKDIADALCSIRVIIQELVRCIASQTILSKMEGNQDADKSTINHLFYDPTRIANFDLVPNLIKKLPRNYKIVMCNHIAQGRNCSRGSTCFFAHTEKELDIYRAIHHKKVKERCLNNITQSLHVNTASQEFPNNNNNNRHPCHHTVPMGNGIVHSPNMPHCSNDTYPSPRYNSGLLQTMDVKDSLPLNGYYSNGINLSPRGAASDSRTGNSSSSVSFENQMINPFGPISRENNVCTCYSQNDNSLEYKKHNPNCFLSTNHEEVFGEESTPVLEWQGTRGITQAIKRIRLDPDPVDERMFHVRVVPPNAPPDPENEYRLDTSKCKLLRIAGVYTDEEELANDIRQFELKWESEMAEVENFMPK